MAESPPQRRTSISHINGTDTATFFPTDNNHSSKNPSTTASPPPPPPLTSTTAASTLPPATHILTNASQTIHIELTHHALSIPFATTFTRSPTAGANILFLGTTRSFFQDPTRPVSRLSYSAYPALALRTLLRLAEEVQAKHQLEKICVVHRLGEVAVAEESIIVAVSSAHRGEGWAGAEELLERVKERAEVWKREWFVDGVVVEGRDGTKGDEIGVWRENRERDRMGRPKEADG